MNTNTSTRPYERPAILATYTIHELMNEASVCMAYGSTTNRPITGMENDRPAGNGARSSDWKSRGY